MSKCLHLHITGLVQGVCYRISAQMKATELGLSGITRNLPDGRVEIIVKGDEDKLASYIDWCHCGPAMAQVTDVLQQQIECTEEYNGFNIRY